MAKRSPILGYNHNIRHRGVVFHVQTEDSGVANPHIFTHLFHGGVIITTRKLVYDAEADEDVVKALMQAQHKAIMRELKAGAFAQKISLYLADNPDLLPADEARPEPAAAGAAASESASEPATPELAPTPGSPAVSAEHAAPPVAAAAEPAPPPAGETPAPSVVEAPAAAAAAGPPAIEPVPVAAEGPSEEPDTEPFTLAPQDAVEWKQSDPSERPFLRAGKDVSAAIDAILSDDVPEATPSEITDDVVSIHAPAPPSAPEPPGLRPQARPGSYLHARKPTRAQSPPAAPRVSFRGSSGQARPPTGEGTGRTPTEEQMGRAPTQEKLARTRTQEQLGRAPTQEHVGRTRTQERLGRAPTQEKVGRTRTQEQMGRAPTQEKVGRTRTRDGMGGAPTPEQPGRTPTREHAGRPAASARAAPPSAERQGPSSPERGRLSRAQTQDRFAPRPAADESGRGAAPGRDGADSGGARQRAKTARGVVVSRPAVIVGAPPTVVGGKSGSARRAPRVRKAQAEEKGDSLFGKGLISEKSLDEVILAYLSDDTSDE